MEGESNNISDSRLMKGVLDEHNGQGTKVCVHTPRIKLHL